MVRSLRKRGIEEEWLPVHRRRGKGGRMRELGLNCAERPRIRTFHGGGKFARFRLEIGSGDDNSTGFVHRMRYPYRYISISLEWIDWDQID